MMTTVADLAHVPDGQLTERLYQLCGEERVLVVEQLIHLAELDRRKLYLELGFSSLFDFCRRYMGLTKSKAYRRMTAARLLARFPVVAEHLRDGRLCVTTLVELRDVLDEERLDEILSRAAGRTEEEVQELAAALKPRPAPVDLFRRLLAPAAAPVPIPVPAEAASGFSPERPEQPTATPPKPRPPGKIEPISEELRVLRITVGREFAEDLARARAAFGQPGAGLEQVIHHCLRAALTQHERRRRGTGRAQRVESRAEARYIPAAVRDAVWRRDGGRCAFVGSGSVRCDSTERLHFHHLLAYARGGAATIENISLRCPAHNRLHAEQDFGRDHVAQAIENASRA